jgi:CBS domain-containing protein
MSPIRKVPIHVRETLNAHGTPVRRLAVYCPARAETIPLEVCAACRELRSLPAAPDAPGACLACTPPVAPPTNETVGALAAHDTVGEVMGARIVLIEPDAPFGLVSEAFALARASLVPVVEGPGTFVGVVWQRDLAKACPPFATAADALDARPIALEEAAPMRDALRVMTIDRIRAVPVLARGGLVSGVLTDVALLTWYGAARRREHERA